MSLAIATCAAANLVGSAWLVARISTLVGDGRTAGAVYIPSAVIVPALLFPSATPFTLHVTAVFVVFVTVAVNVWMFPSKTDALAGATCTVIEGGGGGGGGATGPAPPPPQPSVHALTVRRPKNPIARGTPAQDRGRDGTPEGMQAKGQRNKFTLAKALSVAQRPNCLS